MTQSSDTAQATQNIPTASPDEQFLNHYSTLPNVTKLADGLQYRILKEGTGKHPSLKDAVTVHYQGKLVNQKVFDSSYERNEPLTLHLNQVIKGWQEALPLMKEGAKWELVIPAKLAYGETGVSNVIPPNSTLIFEVELISVNP